MSSATKALFHKSKELFHLLNTNDAESDEPATNGAFSPEDYSDDSQDVELGQRAPLLHDTKSATSSSQIFAANFADEHLLNAGSQNRQDSYFSAPVHGMMRDQNGDLHEVRVFMDSSSPGPDIPDDNFQLHPMPSGSGDGMANGGSHINDKVPLKTQYRQHQSLGYPREIKKTLGALVFMILNIFLTGVSLALVHELMPNYPPLPDQILDRVAYQKWALFGSEHLIQLQTVIAFVVILFQKHRWIISRRVFVIIGIIYLYRAVTMWVTILPKADTEYYCDPKLNGTLTVGVIVTRALKIVTGFGLSVNGYHVYCGDYIYSGHTAILVLGFLVVKEYTPKRYFALHWLAWVNACISVALLLLSRGHYTVDVIIAYFIVTRSWATYHTLAGHASLRECSSINHFSTFWWFDAFCWLECNVKPGKIPCQFSLPWPIKLFRRFCSRIIRRTPRTRNLILP